MTERQADELKLALFEFVKRASKPGATDAEIEALPAVANALVEVIKATFRYPKIIWDPRTQKYVDA